jgi:uncharacterized protein (TIGR03083 family)
MIRDWIASERRELAGLLGSLSAEQWDAPSLCEGWAVRHVVAHLTMPFRYSVPRFLLGIAKAGGSFRRMSDGVARRDGELPPARLIAAVADNAEHPWKPPGQGYEAALTHDVIHTLDITRALGLEWQLPAEPMTAVLKAITGPPSLKHFGVDLDGVRLEAVDLDWSWGSGAPMRGPAQDLALVLTGRRVPAGARGGSAGQ